MGKDTTFDKQVPALAHMQTPTVDWVKISDP